MMEGSSPLVRTFKEACKAANGPLGAPPPDLRAVIRASNTPDGRRYNAPAADEVAGFMPGDGDAQVCARIVGVLEHALFCMQRQGMHVSQQSAHASNQTNGLGTLKLPHCVLCAGRPP